MMLIGCNRRALVVGAGPVGRRKAQGLLAAGVAVTILSPDPPGEGAVTHLHGRWPDQAPPLEEFDLIVAATNERQVNASIAAAGRAAGKLVNVVDAPDEGDFHTVATIRAGAAVIALSTEGASPALTARLRAAMENWLADHPDLTRE